MYLVWISTTVRYKKDLLGNDEQLEAMHAKLGCFQEGPGVQRREGALWRKFPTN